MFSVHEKVKMMPADIHEFFEQFIRGKSASSNDFRRFVELLWESYAEEVFLFAYAKLENLEDARDICQDTFVRVIEWLRKNPGHMPMKLNFPAWLRRIARNLIIDRFRRPALELQWSAVTGDAQEEQFFADWPEKCTYDPTNHVSKEEELDALRQCIETLPEQRRRVLTLRDIENLSYEAIAKKIGKPCSTIGVILHRTRKELRDCVQLRLVL